MPYEPTEWIDKTATTPGTKINRQRMMKLEQGLADATDKAEDALSKSGTSGTRLRESVATSTALPTTGNEAGDARITEDTGHFWVWDGTDWVDAGPVGIEGPAGPGSTVTTDRGVITHVVVDEGWVPDPGDDVTDATVAAALGPSSRAVLDEWYSGGGSDLGVNVLDHDPPTGTANAAPALNAAASAARTAGKPLRIPFGTYYIDTTVNLRGLDVYCDGSIIVRHTNAVGVIVGDDANLRQGRRIDIREVKHAGTTYGMTTWAHPALRVIGLVSGEVRVGFASLMELWGDNTIAADEDVAYSNFYLGRVNHLRLWAQGTFGWVNENNFYGGSYNRITLGGPSPQYPDHNVWYKPCVEGSSALIDVQRGSNNSFYDCRPEGNTSVSFGEVTHHNRAISSYNETPILMGGTWGTVTDLGSQNVVADAAQYEWDQHLIYRLDRDSVVVNGAGDGLSNTGSGIPIPPVGDGKFEVRAIWASFIDLTIPLEVPASSTIVSNYLLEQSRVDRLLLHSLEPWIEGGLYGYDEDGNVVDPQVTPFLRQYAGIWDTWAGRYQASPSAAVPIVITNPIIKAIRFAITPSSAGTLFTDFNVTAFLHQKDNPRVIDVMRRKINRPTFQTAKPTEGSPPLGTRIGSNQVWVRSDKTLTAAAASAATTITTNAGYMANADVVGIALDNGRSHWAAITAVDGTSVTISPALPSAAASGNAVSVTRWQAI